MAEDQGQQPTGTTPAAGAPTAAAAPEPSFPANTPLEQMSDAQQAAYWKYHSRQHESRVKALGSVTPEQIAELRDKAKRADDLEAENATDVERRERAAREAAANEADAKYLPMLAQARIEGAAAGRVNADALSKALEFTDMSKFITNGQVDTAKVTAFVDSIAPATGTQQEQRPKGPVVARHGTGGTPSSGPTGGNVAAGRDLWAEMHPTKAS